MTSTQTTRRMTTGQDIQEGRTYRFPAGSVRQVAVTIEVESIHDRMPNCTVFFGRRLVEGPRELGTEYRKVHAYTVHREAEVEVIR